MAKRKRKRRGEHDHSTRINLHEITYHGTACGHQQNQILKFLHALTVSRYYGHRHRGGHGVNKTQVRPSQGCPLLLLF